MFSPWIERSNLLKLDLCWPVGGEGFLLFLKSRKLKALSIRRPKIPSKELAPCLSMIHRSKNVYSIPKPFFDGTHVFRTNAFWSILDVGKRNAVASESVIEILKFPRKHVCLFLRTRLSLGGVTHNVSNEQKDNIQCKF